MQKEIHIPVTKVRYVHFVFNRFNQKLGVNGNHYQYFHHYDYSGFQKKLCLVSLQQNSCSQEFGKKREANFGFMENITQCIIQEDLNIHMYIINIFKMSLKKKTSFLGMWLSFWHGSIKFSLLVWPNEFLCWLSLVSLF